MPPAMRRLLLLRHAKSDWGDNTVPDHDRPLAPRGIRSADLLRDHLEGSGERPSLVLCSSARRTRETLAHVLPGLGRELDVRIEPGLYTFSSLDVLQRVREIPDDVTTAMVVGHNPATEDLARMLASNGGELIGSKYPTGGLAVLELEAETWAAAGKGNGALLSFTTPKQLGST